MMPGMNPKKMQKMMKQMGIKQNEIPAVRVIIETENEQYVFEKPSVTETNMQGQASFQVVGKYTTRPIEKELVIPDDDIELVSMQSGKPKEQARAALEKTGGDLAEAILELQKE